MTSSSEESESEMNSSGTESLTEHPHKLYKDRFPGKNGVVGVIGDDKDEKNGSDPVWTSEKGKTLATKRINKVAYMVDPPVMMQEDDILACPLGEMVRNEHNKYIEELKRKKMEEEKKKKRTRMKPTRKTNDDAQQSTRKAGGHDSDDEDGFIVPDGVIDPPRKRRHAMKPVTKSPVETIAIEESEEDAPIMKKGKKALVEKVVASTPKRRGRPPKNTMTEMSSKNKETPPRKGRKGDKEAKSRTKTNIVRMVESEEDEDEIQVIEPEKTPNRRSTRINKTKKPEQKKKKVESEESEEEQMKTRGRGGRSVGRKREAVEDKKTPSLSDEDSEEEEEEVPTVPLRRKSLGRKAKVTQNRGKNVDDLFECSEDDDEKRKKVNKETKKKKRSIDSDGSEDDNGYAKQKESKKRKTKETESEKSEEEEEEEEENSEMPSTSGRKKKAEEGKKIDKKKKSGEEMTNEGGKKTSYEMHVEREKARKKRMRSSLERTKKKELMAKEAKKDMNTGDFHLRSSSRLLDDDDSCVDDGADEHRYFVARSGNRSRSGSPVPTLLSSAPGSSCNSRIGSRAGSRVGSREGSPEIGGGGGGSASGIPELAAASTRLEVLVAVEKMRKEEEERKIKEKREEERKMKEQREKNESAASASPVPPVNPTEKIRAKPKVAMRNGRDAGIVDFGPANSSGRSSALSKRGGTGVWRGGGRSFLSGSATRAPSAAESISISSELDIFGSIQTEMDQPLPSAPSIDRSLGGDPNYVNPTRVRMYAPDNQIGNQKETSKRIEYRGANAIEEPHPIDGQNGRSITPRDGDKGGNPSHPIVISSSSSSSVAQPFLSPSHHYPDSFENEEIVGGMGNSPIDELIGPASPDHHIDSRNAAMHGEGLDDIYGAVIGDPILQRIPVNPPVRNYDRPEMNLQTTNRILRELKDRIEDGDADEVIWALDWKYEKEGRGYFDRVNNRKLIYELISSSPPSVGFFSALCRIDEWDVAHCDRGRRLYQLGMWVEDIHPAASLSFLTLPFVEQRDGMETRKTPLSEAVRLEKFEWAQFLITRGANVNDKVSNRDFDGYIIQYAIDRTPLTSGLDFNMIRLLLDYGANRASALSYLESMKAGTLQEPGLNEGNFDHHVPFYRELHILLKNACDSISNVFQSQLRNFEELEDFTFHHLGETTCTVPYKKGLVLELRDHYNGIMKSKSPFPLPIFAVVVGMAHHSVMKRNEHPSAIHNSEVHSIRVEHTPEEPPFQLFPCGIKRRGAMEEPAMNSIEFIPLRDSMGVFIIPRQLYPHLKACVIRVDDRRVGVDKIVYGELVRLILRDGHANEERVNAAVRRLTGGDGNQYEGIY